MDGQDVASVPGSFNSISLNEDQRLALYEIMCSARHGGRHLLTGYAGTGKTTLMQSVASELGHRGMRVVLTAPTHKAVSVLARKLREGGLDVPCRTIQSLLALRPTRDGPVMKFARDKRARSVDCDAVVIDECSMVDQDLFALVQKHLHAQFVLFVGDPAQLPPVNERESLTFSISPRSNLGRVVRQAEGNPILQAAAEIRESQGKALNMSWARSVKSPPLGVFRPADPEAWMKKAFTSLEFDQNPDRFRCLCWTNERVSKINSLVRSWRYGKTNMPFVAGERALMRQPVFGEPTIDPITREIERPIILNTNDEAEIESIESNSISGIMGDKIEFNLDIWKIKIIRDDGMEIEVNIAKDDNAAETLMQKLRSAAIERRLIWQEYHDFRSSIVKMQSVYAMTVHCSQGSTFGSVFMDISDILRRSESNLLECQQMLYVAATRPSTSLILI